MKKYFLVFLMIVVFVSCSKSEDDDTSIKNQEVTGTVQNEPFTFKGGKAFLTTNFNDEEAISINLTNEIVGCDVYINDYGLSISIIAPLKVGVHKEVNIVTQDGNGIPFNHLDETIEITALSDTEVSGKIKLNNPASGPFKENIFEGTFTVLICE